MLLGRMRHHVISESLRKDFFGSQQQHMCSQSTALFRAFQWARKFGYYTSVNTTGKLTYMLTLSMPRINSLLVSPSTK